MKGNNLKDLETNIISWYEFKENSKILFCGEKESSAYEYLKGKYKNVEIYNDECSFANEYDYIIVLKSKIDEAILTKISMFLKETGIILLSFDNEYGISKFVTYKYKTRVSPLEQIEGKLGKEAIENILRNKGYKYINTYMPFPNWKRADVILSGKLESFYDKIDRYFLDYEEDDAIIANEINLLKNISKYDKELFIKLSNSYLLEISKVPIDTSIKYISFNNYRKPQYSLITIIKDDIVEKRQASKEGVANIKRIAQNLEELNKYDFEILDKYEEGRLYSKFIKGYNTLDIELGNNYNNLELVVKKLNEIKEVLLKNSIKYNKKDRKNYNKVLNKQSDEILEKLNYLEYAFYDMVPKNCFYIDDKYYFFDQEWMEKYLPVEFIIYRSIINSYDLVRKIDVDELLEKMGLKEYKELFEEIDRYLRKEILDEERFEKLNKTNKKMYEIIYDYEVLKIQNAAYKENDMKQNEYIKVLESKMQENNK